MKLSSLSQLTLSAVAASAIFALPAVAATGCLFNKVSSTGTPTTLDTSPWLSGESPNLQSLIKVVGGFGVMATVAAGGVQLYRKRQEAAAAALDSDLAFATHTESVMVPESLVPEDVSPEGVNAETPVSQKQELELHR